MPSRTTRAGSRPGSHAQERALERARNDVTVLMAERAHLSRPERLEPLARSSDLSLIAAAQYMRLDPAPERVSTR